MVSDAIPKPLENREGNIPNYFCSFFFFLSATKIRAAHIDDFGGHTVCMPSLVLPVRPQTSPCWNIKLTRCPRSSYGRFLLERSRVIAGRHDFPFSFIPLSPALAVREILVMHVFAMILRNRNPALGSGRGKLGTA